MIRLCHMDELPKTGSCEFALNDTISTFTIFVVRKFDSIHIYENSCPHTLGPLDWGNGQFLDFDQQYIQCSHHGALFEIENGYCIYGPCHGASLNTVQHQIIDGWIHLEL